MNSSVRVAQVDVLLFTYNVKETLNVEELVGYRKGVHSEVLQRVGGYESIKGPENRI